MSKEKSRRVYSLAELVEVALVGFAIGIIPISGHVVIKEKVPMKPISVTYEHRNSDNLKDQVQKYEDGIEIVLYAEKNSEGDIVYSPR